MSAPLDDDQVSLLSAYLDDEVDAAERARAEALLAAEPAARDWLEEARADAGLLRDLAPAIDTEALDQARRRAESSVAACGYEEGRHMRERQQRESFWGRLRAALTPSRVTGLAVPALAIVLAVLAPDRRPPQPGPRPSEAPPMASTTAAPAATEVATRIDPQEAAPTGAPNKYVTVRSLSDAPPRRAQVVPRDPETLVVAMHLEEADVDLIWMMPPGGTRTRRTR